MVTRPRASRTRHAQRDPLKRPGDPQNRLGRKSDPSQHVYGGPVPEGLHEAIESERDNLSKVESLLSCMVLSMEYQNAPLDGPYYPAVAQLARELVEQSINGLDPFVLRQRLLRNKIEEVFCVSFLDTEISPSAPGEFKASAHRLAA
jgi:hypothetical protein